MLSLTRRSGGFGRSIRTIRESSTTMLAALDSRQLRFYGNYGNNFSGNEDSGKNRDGGDDGGFSAFFESLSRSFLSVSTAATMEPSLVKLIGGETLRSTCSKEMSQSLFMASTSSIDSTKVRRSYGPYIYLSSEERDLFRLLRQAREESGLDTTLRVAGGWVRDKLLATPEFARPHHDQGRLTSKYKQSSMGRQGTKILDSDVNQPVDIDIALDDMLGREFAERLNEYLEEVGEQTHSVGVVLKNPEKSKHLETATMKVGTFWIDFVNLRAEEYTQDSRIPDLMRIGTPAEDAFRRDLTINSLFYNINNGQVEDWTGRGFDDLRRGIVATPLAPLTTLLDDPLRALRSVRFAARLRFTMDDSLVNAAMDRRVRQALAEKVSRERIGGEVDLMLRSPDPVGAMRLLINLKLVGTVFPVENCLENFDRTSALFGDGLELLTESHGHLSECNAFPPNWCQSQGSYTTHGVTELTLREDCEARRFLWYASFLKPVYDHSKRIAERKVSQRQGKKANRSAIYRLLVEELKRPLRETESVEKIIAGANEFTRILDSGCDLSAVSILLSDIRVTDNQSSDGPKLKCYMGGKRVYSTTEDDPLWEHAMEFRLLCAKVINKVGPLWRAALFLSLSERLTHMFAGDLDYVIEGDIVDESQEELRRGEIERYDAFATAMQQIGVIGIWNEKPLIDGRVVKEVLPCIPVGPAFRDVMDEQEHWMIQHPGGTADDLVKHLADKFPEYAERRTQGV